jgi:putative transposase
MPKAIHAQQDRRAAESNAKETLARLKELKVRTAAELVEQNVEGGRNDDLLCLSVDPLATNPVNNSLERIIREIRRRTRVVEVFRLA